MAISVTTLDRKLARAMEPRAPTPERRIEAIRELSKAGIPTAVMPAPMIPALNDHEMEAILERARDAGAHAMPAMWFCGCRLRSRICSANGWRRTNRGARRM